MKKNLLNISFLCVSIALISWGIKTPHTTDNKVLKESTILQKQPGEKVFRQYCASCHQVDGGGVPNMTPPLIGTKYVLGEKPQLIKIVLKGLNENIVIDDEEFNNPMPPFAHLNDSDIANVLTYIRSSFGNKASTVSAKEVKAVRVSLNKKK